MALGTPKRDRPFLLRMTADQDNHVRARAYQWQVALNTALSRIIDQDREGTTPTTDQQRAQDELAGICRVPLTSTAHAYVTECAEKWGVTPEKAIQKMILNSYLATQEAPRHPGGTRKERGARQKPPRRSTPAPAPTFSHSDPDQ